MGANQLDEGKAAGRMIIRLAVSAGLVGVSVAGQLTSYPFSLLWWMFVVLEVCAAAVLVTGFMKGGYRPHLAHAELLHSLLPFHQRVTWRALGWIAVRGSLGHWYLIHPDTIMNVHRGWRRYCVQPYGVFSVEGTVVAQYLAIKTDELRFRATAVKGAGLLPW